MRASSRYAKSFIDLSLEQGSLEVAFKDMTLVWDTCQSCHDLVLMLKSPIVKEDKKMSILNEVFGNAISPLSLSFIGIIVRKKRAFYIEEIAKEFINQYKEYKKIITAVITSAVGLDDVLRKKVLEIVKSSSDSEIELVEKINKDLIGGFVLKVGDNQIDASILRQIKNLRRGFSENPYVK